MDDNVVLDAIGAIPFGVVLGWICGIGAIIGGLVLITLKLYKAFEKFKKSKDENEKLHKEIKMHEHKFEEVDQRMAAFSTTLLQIQESLEEQRKRELKKLRYSIVRAGESAISKGSIAIRELKSLEELYDDYANNFHQNGYVKTLMIKVRDLKVIGTIDDDDEH